MSYPSPFNFPPPGESYNTTPTTPIEGIDFQLPQWETVEREQQQQQRLQHQDQPQPPHPHSHPPTPTTYQTIQLEEQPPPPPRAVPGQIHLESAPAAHVHTHGHEGRSGLLHTLDYSSLSTHISDFLRPISISPPAASTSSGPGLVARQTRSRPETTHPYRRPQSALGTRAATTATSTVQGRSRTQPAAQASSSMQAVRSMSGSSSSHRSSATVTQLRSGPPSPDLDTYEQGKRYLIRADVHVDPESKVFTALLELPGVRKDEVRVTLSRCWYNGVKQVTIGGRTRDPFPSSQGGQGLGKVVKERKYGRFIRTFAVSPDTKLEDIDVSMEDGVLALKIQNSQLFVESSHNVQDVPIR